MTANNLNKLNIPETIRIGCQNRNDTYTGKLAYVIYYDNKKVLRKYDSWEHWRDKKIDPIDFKNEPISGFVLNKKVGDTKYGWNHRQSAVRVFDPRGFEFEISVQNLLFILEECTSIKGKGLEGDFVYAWDKSDLVLLPVSSIEYQNSVVHTELQTKKVSSKEFVNGHLYKGKDGNTYMYIGRHALVEYIKLDMLGNITDDWKYSVTTPIISKKKDHVFIDINNKPDYNTLHPSHDYLMTKTNKIAEKIGDDVSSLYADEYEKFIKSFYVNIYDTIEYENISESAILEMINSKTYRSDRYEYFIKTDDFTFESNSNLFYNSYVKYEYNTVNKIFTTNSSRSQNDRSYIIKNNKILVNDINKTYTFYNNYEIEFKNSLKIVKISDIIKIKMINSKTGNFYYFKG